MSAGPWNDAGGRDAIELLFEDGTDAPFSIILGKEQTDRWLPETDQGGGFNIAVWSETGLQLELPGRYRRVRAIPDLTPWVDH